MPIVSGDLEWRLSVDTGPGDANAQADPNDSLGGFVATTAIVDATLHNLFDVVTGDENAASDVEYRCIFICNTHATLTLQDAVAWLSAEVAGGAVAAIALDGVGIVDTDSASAQSEIETGEGTAPTGETFSAPTTKGTGIAIGDIGPGQCQAIWVRRTAANTAAADDDGVTIRFEGDTGA